ncbi:UPF0236 family protein, partial [Enterococcus cecorum]|nr:UPF0236 family protein [Enterococcus cecorum]
GYTAYTFNELVKSFGCKHEHFYDEYHVNDSIKRIFKNVPALKNKAIEAIKTHSRKNLKTVFDTFESMITDEKILQRFWDISKRILTNFQYTLPARKRGFSHEGIGIMESQHCKISNRMKHRKMKWSIKGAETMARMIIDIGQNKLDDLFFGEWRGGYIKMQLKGFSAAKLNVYTRLFYTSPSPPDGIPFRMPSFPCEKKKQDAARLPHLLHTPRGHPPPHAIVTHRL